MGLAVHGQRRGHVDVRVIEVRHLGLPVLVGEVEEERADDFLVVERRAGQRLDVALRDLRPRTPGLGDAHAARTAAATAAGAAAGHAPTHAAAAHRAAARPQRLARNLPLLAVEPVVAVLVEVLHDLAHAAHAARPAHSRTHAQRRPVLPTAAEATGLGPRLRPLVLRRRARRGGQAGERQPDQEWAVTHDCALIRDLARTCRCPDAGTTFMGQRASEARSRPLTAASTRAAAAPRPHGP
jgi:hypothetical protein